MDEQTERSGKAAQGVRFTDGGIAMDAERITLRDRLAMAALTGLLAHHGVYEEDAAHHSLCDHDEQRRRENALIDDDAASAAYGYADAMLRARIRAAD